MQMLRAQEFPLVLKELERQVTEALSGRSTPAAPAALAAHFRMTSSPSDPWDPARAIQGAVVRRRGEVEADSECFARLQSPTSASSARLMLFKSQKQSLYGLPDESVLLLHSEVAVRQEPEATLLTLEIGAQKADAEDEGAVAEEVRAGCFRAPADNAATIALVFPTSDEAGKWATILRHLLCE